MSVKQTPITCFREIDGFAILQNTFKTIDKQPHKDTSSTKTSLKFPALLKRNKIPEVSSPQVNLKQQTHIPKEKAVPAWASSWKIEYTDGSSKTFNVTLFNSKYIGKNVNIFEKLFPEENEDETTYIQIDDTEIAKERSTTILSGKEIYHINPNEFKDLKKDLGVGTHKFKISLQWRLIVKAYLIKELFPPNFTDEETQTDPCDFLELPNQPENPETLPVKTEEIQAEETPASGELFPKSPISSSDKPSISSKNPNCCNSNALIAIAILASSIVLGFISGMNNN